MVGVALAVLIFVADRIHRRPIAGAALVMGAIGFVPVWVMIPFEPNVPPATLACFLVVLALIPTLAVIWLDLAQHLPFGGTTILIMVGVGLQTVKEVNSQLQQRHYEGFLS